jgi:hypothetical protein
MLFTFPWSHGLVPLAAWSGFAALALWAVRRDVRAAVLVAAMAYAKVAEPLRRSR